MDTNIEQINFRNVLLNLFTDNNNIAREFYRGNTRNLPLVNRILDQNDDILFMIANNLQTRNSTSTFNLRARNRPRNTSIPTMQNNTATSPNVEFYLSTDELNSRSSILTTIIEQLYTDFESSVNNATIPSEEEIIQNTEVIEFSAIANPNQLTCPISLEGFLQSDILMRINSCSHIFKECNLREHFRRRSRCPVCRFDIKSQSDA